MNKGKEILIVGGGLAGTFLAAELCKKGNSVTMMDKEAPQSASRIAAGLYNVVTGRKATKTWMAETMLEALENFLKHPDFIELNQYYHRKKIYRPFKNLQNYNDWMALSLDEDYFDLVQHHPEPIMQDIIKNDLGGLYILPCGWADITAILSGIKNILSEKYSFKIFQDAFEFEGFDPVKCEINVEGKPCVFDWVIFCEGIAILNNPYFNWMDMRPLKGQIMDVEIEGFQEDFILAKKVFMIPKGNNIYTVGATYELNYKDENPDKSGLKWLSNQLKKAMRLPFKVIDQRASVRPTTYDRRPVAGRHPEFEKLYVFNGLGAKGVIQSPWCAAEMAEWLMNNDYKLLSEFELHRFLKKIS